jgi:hypothetical protein
MTAAGPTATTTPPATVAAVRLHLPDAPEARREAWRTRVLDGTDLAEVVCGDDGVAAWLWTRWQVLAGAGMDRGTFVALVGQYRREIWLWLYGDRTWEQCCSGLIGRIERRLAR